MDGKSIKCMLLIGLCTLYSCSSQVYHLVNTNKTWAEAQMYCREMYTDLVTINSTEEMTLVNNLLNNRAEEFWIGLHSSSNEWLWSLEKEGFYGDGQADFRLWNGEQGSPYDHFHCAEIFQTDGWHMYDCYEEQHFVCYNDSGSKYVYVNKNMNWTDAQKYCRANHTDLASVRNQSENDAIRQLLVDSYAWIGLYRESWRWSDGQRLKMTSFSKWNQSQTVDVEDTCVTTRSGVWNMRPCSNTYPFICSALSKVQPIERKLVKITLSTSASSLDLEESQDAILQQLRDKLPEHGLGDLKLRWIKQSDGKTFHLKKKDKK